MSAIQSPFVLPASEYKRDIDVFRHYVDQASAFLALRTGRSQEYCREYVKKNLKADGRFPFKDPAIQYLRRNENGDREKVEGTLGGYLAESVKEHQLIAPTLTTYYHPKVKKSLLAGFIDNRVSRRKVAKGEMFKAKMDGNEVLRILKDNEQTNMKLTSNACSGAHVSASTPLYNKTAHSTLTSNCRCTAGYGSANNEKLLNGNRHYWSPDIVKNNIIAIIQNTDYLAIDAAMTEFGIRHPSVEETMECIRYSTQLYFRDKAQHEQIEALIKKLSAIQRSAFVYTGDLYHLMRFNDQVVRDFITDLSSPTIPVEGVDFEHVRTCLWPRRTDVDFDAHRKTLKSANEDHVALAAQLVPSAMRGLKVSDTVNGEVELLLASTTEHVGSTVERYRNFIRAFFVTKNVPASLAVFPESIRRSALMGDTDSTIFTVQDWVTWYNRGKLGYDDRSSGVAATMIFLSAQTVTHILARMSANFGIEESRVFQVAMKNEFKFDVFVPTQVAKHYYASIGCQEGNLLAAQDTEIKGVHLKSSNAPRAVMAQAKAMMVRIMETIMAEKQISALSIIQEIADLEHEIRSSILERSSYEYFRIGQIKTAESYTLPPEKSNFAYYTLWNETFGTKYGMVPEPPYSSVKISVDLKSPAKIKAWLSAMEDRDLAEKLASWMLRAGKKQITTFHVPEQIIQSVGIPKEILSQVALRKIITDTTSVFYLICESLGIYLQNKQMTRLFSDLYAPTPKEPLKEAA
ncbi:family B DNA polymerase [Paraburkholderia sp. BCC1886]|uniref:family B DNA polymerase n=1 Tax=Paraburkholderia sp. BCC1886 TaxID=2562670 RepID=UPI0011829A90|nr:family B DNA polymerase [Paraburkholderia sp. BCC1886]